MILLSEDARVVAVLGTGLIGSAVVGALSGMRAEAHPLTWTPGPGQDSHLRALEARIAGLCAAPAPGSGSLALLWSAGRAGFDAAEEQTAAELSSFRAALAAAGRLTRRLPETPVAFHLVSSAGGLFEGQRRVDAASRPAPRRPYGRLKLAQEDLLRESDARLARRIWRVTSVYGYLRSGQRIGLISALLMNGLRQQVSRITGRMTTLRDFVFVGDVADHLARRLIAPGGPEETVALLAQGKPTSLFEVQTLVEGVLGRRLYVSYSLEPSNSEDITFSPAALPPGWYPTDLASNIRRIHRDAVCRGAAFS